MGDGRVVVGEGERRWRQGHWPMTERHTETLWLRERLMYTDKQAELRHRHMHE